MPGNKSKLKSFLDSWLMISPGNLSCFTYVGLTSKHNKLPHHHSGNLWLFLGFRNVRVLAAQQGPQNLKFETNARLEVLWLYNACCFNSVEFANLLAPAHSTMSKAFSHPMLSLWHIKGTCMRMLFPSEHGHLFWYAKGFQLTCWKCSPIVDRNQRSFVGILPGTKVDRS